MEVVASTDADGNEQAWMYNWDGSGAEGDSIYFSVKANDTVYSFNVRNYLVGTDSDVYAAAQELKIGDTVNLEGFLYWYTSGAQARITNIEVIEK